MGTVGLLRSLLLAPSYTGSGSCRTGLRHPLGAHRRALWDRVAVGKGETEPRAHRCRGAMQGWGCTVRTFWQRGIAELGNH